MMEIKLPSCKKFCVNVLLTYFVLLIFARFTRGQKMENLAFVGTHKIQIWNHFYAFPKKVVKDKAVGHDTGNNFVIDHFFRKHIKS